MQGYKDEKPDEGFEGTEHNILCLTCGLEAPPKVKNKKEFCSKCGSDDVEVVE